MKLRDVIETVGDHKEWIRFRCGWAVDDKGNIRPTLPVNLSLDTEVEIFYQWFWHCDPRVDTREVWDAIKNHDYETFMKWYKKFSRDGWLYFPETASILLKDKHKHVGELDILYDPKVFALIMGQDYECG